MIDPTGQDIAASAAWLHTVFGTQVTASHVEALSWVMASARERERTQIVAYLEEQEHPFAAHDVREGRHREAEEKRAAARGASLSAQETK